MKFGFVLPKGDARIVANMAELAETNNWDGLFTWEPVWGVDAWISLTAAAMVTKKINLGTLISPISRMRPWKFASETATLDNLSEGRVIISVGLGAVETGWNEFGEITDRKTRSELLDESLDIIEGLWRGQPFNYNGKHYQIKECTFRPPDPPVNGNIPIWVVGAWNWPKSMNRVINYDGIIPYILDKDKKSHKTSLDDIKEITEFVLENRGSLENFDIIIENHNIVSLEDEMSNSKKIYNEWEEAGATWWMEGMWDVVDDPNWLEKIKQRIENGP